MLPSAALALLATLAVCASCSPGSETADPLVRPQIILLVSIDTLRADHLGSYGHERFTSPTLDLLASEGVLFEDASATSPWTLPSHASILTGLHPAGHGVVTTATALPDGMPTLASLLAAAGYETAAVINSPWLKQESFQLTRDFSQYLSVQNPDYGRRAPSTWITDQAMDWLKDAGERRIFVFVHYYDVHADYASLPEYEKLFVTPYDGPADGTGWQLQVANFADAHVELCLHQFDPAICAFGSKDRPRVIDPSLSRIRFSDDDVRHLEELYDAGVRQLDTELGRMFAFLREQGLYDKTLLVVTSDHGEEFMEHGRVEHALTTYQEMLHVPLVMRGPGIPPGIRVKAPVSLVDIVPTVLAFAGVTPPSSLDGMDLAPLWRGEGEKAFRERYLHGEAAMGAGHGPALSRIYPEFRSIRQGRYKLVQQSLGGGSALYDLAADPGEQTDIAEREPEVVARLLEEMRRHAARLQSEPGAEGRVEIDPEDVDQLRALGYVP